MAKCLQRNTVGFHLPINKLTTFVLVLDNWDIIFFFFEKLGYYYILTKYTVYDFVLSFHTVKTTNPKFLTIFHLIDYIHLLFVSLDLIKDISDTQRNESISFAFNFIIPLQYVLGVRLISVFAFWELLCFLYFVLFPSSKWSAFISKYFFDFLVKCHKNIFKTTFI